ncbi:hypothetical protein H6F47_16765 [Sphaerospermopsis sp. FACHB-1094]|uniref:TRAFAC clade GTPase domain-containing protein n=1 Tax=Sphaerospermopsis sp. FACHB-1094 TaxID=2692861 RepID=UPI00168669BA|nr:hypothetical protein [Sphaerospermopsis sp. FACHB-1094]MBD2134038.1 hypothetical protein [Sphaerospermopsis sp. FACHB-1094]
MKIVMIGNTNVGKTTYMASLYGIMQEQVEGFSLKAINTNDHARLYELAQAIAHGNYPSATDQRGEYDFFLQHQGKDILAFRWADYRGGAIKEKQSSEQASLLINDLREADGIMMFCDCDALMRGDIRANEIRRMTTLVTQALRDVEKPISLAIILSKTDKISHFQEKIISPFEGLISVINASKWVIGAFIPIACGNQFMNVPIPLLSALYSAVYLQAYVAQALAQKSYDKAIQWQQKSQGMGGFIRWVGDKWNGNPTDEELAQQEFAAYLEHSEKLEFIKDPVLALANYLENIPWMQNGKTLLDYAQACGTLKFYHQFSGAINRKYRDPFDLFS